MSELSEETFEELVAELAQTKIPGHPSPDATRFNMTEYIPLLVAEVRRLRHTLTRSGSGHAKQFVAIRDLEAENERLRKQVEEMKEATPESWREVTET